MRLATLLSLTSGSLLLCCTLATADSKAPLSAADQKTYTAQLRKGRQLEAAGKHADAITAFEAGLAVAPDDATLLGELGASALGAHDFSRAEAATRKAIKNAAAPDVRGATLFNLGLILEQKKDTPGAVAAYSDSLKARPNSVVRARLAKLDAKAAAALDPYKPVAFAGPFASFAAYCKTLPADPPDDEDGYCQCGADPIQKDPAKLTGAGAGAFLQVQIFSHTCGSHHADEYISDYKLAVKLADGWHVVPMETNSVGRKCTMDWKFTDAKPQPGGLVAVTYDITGNCSGGESSYDWTETKQVLFGMGASKVPSAMPPLVKVRHEVETLDEYSGTPRKKTTADIKLDFAWGDGGKLTVSGKTTGVDQNESGNLLGVHAVSFP